MNRHGMSAYERERGRYRAARKRNGRNSDRVLKAIAAGVPYCRVCGGTDPGRGVQGCDAHLVRRG